MTQKSHSTNPPIAHEADDVGFAVGEIAAAFGCRRADSFMDVFRDLEHRATLEALAQLPKPKRPRKPPGPDHDAIIARAKAAGAASVTIECITYTFTDTGLDPVGRELAAFEARHGQA